MSTLDRLFPNHVRELNAILQSAGFAVEAFETQQTMSDRNGQKIADAHVVICKADPKLRFAILLNEAFLGNRFLCSPSLDGHKEFHSESCKFTDGEPCWNCLKAAFSRWAKILALQLEPQKQSPSESSKPEGIEVVGVQNGKRWSAHVTLQEMFQQLQGVVRICDPYYGTGSLSKILLLKNSSDVRFLTKNVDSKETVTFPKDLTAFKSEHPHVQIRQHTQNDIHDRFVIADDTLIILGHGLKDIGGKDSFIVRIDKSVAEDLISELTATFDQRWNAAKVLP